mmetsp:Transcript_3455/g.5089  ORF Transcript_3455/g.5089 Transcript_3455/m.5089 type:complete len:482 (+) Transcript_3455:161-1606(+)
MSDDRMATIDAPNLSPIPVVSESSNDNNQIINASKLKNYSSSVERKLQAYREKSNRVEDKTLIERVLQPENNTKKHQETKKQKTKEIDVKKELKMIQNINNLFPDLVEDTPIKSIPAQKKGPSKKSGEPARVKVLIPELMRRKSKYVTNQPDEPSSILDDKTRLHMEFGSPKKEALFEEQMIHDEDWVRLMDTIKIETNVRGTLKNIETGIDPFINDHTLKKTKNRSSSAKRRRRKNENPSDIESRSQIYKDLSYRPHINYGTRSPSKRFGFLSSYSKRYSIQRHLESYPLHQDCMRRLPTYDPNESLQRKRLAKRHKNHAHHIANHVRSKSAERRRVYDQHGRSHVFKRPKSAKKNRLKKQSSMNANSYEPIQTNYFDDLPKPSYKSDENIVKRLKRIKSKIRSPTLSRHTPAGPYPTARSHMTSRRRRDPDIQALATISQRIGRYKKQPYHESPEKLRSDLSAIDHQIQRLESELAMVS